MRRRFALPLVVLLTAGCYHATVETGLAPGPQVVEEKWAPAFVNGLVPPKTLSAASRCPNGVARVETRLSFLNQIVAGLTFGIFTPMNLKVTCAAQRMGAVDITIPVATSLAIQAGFAQAAQLAIERRTPVFVQVPRTD